jgi:Ca2+-binding EF-hand superfamily protein
MRLLALWLLVLAVFGAPSADEDGLAAGEGIAQHTDEEVQEAREEFADIDLNGDGRITVDEIRAMQV